MMGELEVKCKYYTPTLEEFHVGFEYEHGNSKNESGWETLSFCNSFEDPDWNELKFISEAIKRGNIRVKYLDREDIESLGFSQITDDCFNLPIKEYRGRLNQEIRILIKQTILIYLVMDSTDKDNIVLFTGTIKNKSELVKLLKQLGIK